MTVERIGAIYTDDTMSTRVAEVYVIDGVTNDNEVVIDIDGNLTNRRQVTALVNALNRAKSRLAP